MCTVTVVSARETVRLACNRDELRSRPVARAPHIEQFGRRLAVLPVDPASGGTWIAVNDAGLIMTLLNVNPEDKGEKFPSPLRSRGTIIPGLLQCGSLESAITQATALDAKIHAPFRLLLADQKELAELRADGWRVRAVCRRPVVAPEFFTSSGLGDHLVEGPRRRLFKEILGRPGDLVTRQDLFHRHRWAERPHLSVSMARADARTVSHTVVALGPDWVTLTYHPDAPGQPAKTVSVTLAIAAGGIA